jgi:hypothetical protein
MNFLYGMISYVSPDNTFPFARTVPDDLYSKSGSFNMADKHTPENSVPAGNCAIPFVLG